MFLAKILKDFHVLEQKNKSFLCLHYNILNFSYWFSVAKKMGPLTDTTYFKGGDCLNS